MARDGRPRYFRVAEVNAMLPTLAQLMERMRTLMDEARASHRELRLIHAVGHREDGTLIMETDYALARERLETVLSEVDEIKQSIESTGCIVRSVDLGLVNFPAVINGQEVFLCWRLGEEEVMYYHGLEDGYAGRRRLHPADDDTPP